MIDWSQIQTPEDIFKLDRAILYDDSPEFDPEDNYILNPNLTDEEIEDALFWRDYLRGIMLVTGMPGQGKDMFVHMLAWKMRHYFHKTIISDSRPREEFGHYIPFNIDFLVDQLDRISEVATHTVKDYDPENPPKVMPHATPDGRWISSKGQVFMRRSVMILDEFGSRYMHIRRPLNPVQVTLLQLFPFWRHLQCLILGVGTERNDFSPRCFPKVTAEARCFRISKTRLIFGVALYPLRHIGATGELEIAGRPAKFPLNGEKPRDCLGGLAWKDLYNTDNAVAMEAQKSLRPKKRVEPMEQQGGEL